MARVVRGRGYLYQGQWLGFDPSVMGKVKIRRDEIIGEEEVDGFTRYVTSAGHVWVVFAPYEEDENERSHHQPPRRIEVTTIEAESQDSLKKPRIIYLPANLPRHPDQK